MVNRLGTENLYGSARLGAQQPKALVYPRLPNQGPADLSAGSKRYELTNHLGNVLSTVSDLLTPVDTDNNNTTDHFAAIVHNQQAYYPFGMLMPGLQYTPPGERNSRYGFNGKENDDEVKGSGIQQDYGMRYYDARLGKFLSVDPLFKSYPWYTPYQFAGNMTIIAIDLDGLEELIVIRWFDGNVYKGTTIFRVHDKRQREAGKRSDGDMEIIELDESFRSDFKPNSKDITSISPLIKNGDNTFKGIYKSKTDLLESEKLALASLMKLDFEFNSGVSKFIKQDDIYLNYYYNKSLIISQEQIEKIKLNLNTDPARLVVIEAFASSEGSEDYNCKLSQSRANEVFKILVNSGIDANRIKSVQGQGETIEWGDNSSEKKRAPNRKAVVKIAYEKTQSN